jgi:ribosomal protein S18 acetylase RimI-like enzyme
MSLYADYIRERTGDEIIERDNSFVTFRFLNENKAVYIVDIFVKPDCRDKNVAGQLADTVAQIAKAKGCTEMLGSVMPSAKGSTTSLKILLAYGFQLQSAGNDAIIFRKDI